jgi:fructose-specific component phosphotransferase system IIB-like protein
VKFVKKLNVQRAQIATNAELAIVAKEAADPIVPKTVQIIASHIAVVEPSLQMANF